MERGKTSTTRRSPLTADTKQWYLITDDKCCIQPRFLTIQPYCFGGSLPLDTKITRGWEWLSWQIGIKGIFIPVQVVQLRTWDLANYGRARWIPGSEAFVCYWELIGIELTYIKTTTYDWAEQFVRVKTFCSKYPLSPLQSFKSSPFEIQKFRADNEQEMYSMYLPVPTQVRLYITNALAFTYHFYLSNS